MPRFEKNSQEKESTKKSPEKKNVPTEKPEVLSAKSALRKHMQLMKKYPEKPKTYIIESENEKGKYLSVRIEGNNISYSVEYPLDMKKNKKLFTSTKLDKTYSVDIKGNAENNYYAGRSDAEGSASFWKSADNWMSKSEKVIKDCLDKKKTAMIEDEFDDKLDQAYA